ncbi:MAG: MotA/TolQ/ExbB proton channel family protein [Candidatus Eisenbacteria bacterium]
MSTKSFLVFMAFCLGLGLFVVLGSSDAQMADTSLAEESMTAAAEQAAQPEETWVDRMRQSGVVDLYVRGKSFMHPILICSIIGIAFIIERLYTIGKAGTDTKKLMGAVLAALKADGLVGARSVLEKTKGPIAAVLHAGLLRVERGPDAAEKAIVTAAAIETSFLERGLIWLATVANIAPLLGFLGTVSGMIHAFEAIAAAEQVSAKLVASGISEALITTAAGLIVAIPTQTAYNYFTSRVDRFVVEMEEASAELLDAIAERSTQKAAS